LSGCSAAAASIRAFGQSIYRLTSVRWGGYGYAPALSPLALVVCRIRIAIIAPRTVRFIGWQTIAQTVALRVYLTGCGRADIWCTGAAT
jgi:hypothetical protein